MKKNQQNIKSMRDRDVDGIQTKQNNGNYEGLRLRTEVSYQ